jgi:hypothetical protein
MAMLPGCLELSWGSRGCRYNASMSRYELKSSRVFEVVVIGLVLLICQSSHSLTLAGVECHTIKYPILGCEYLLQCVHLSIGFSKNFKEFSSNYSIYRRARSIFLLGKL